MKRTSLYTGFILAILFPVISNAQDNSTNIEGSGSNTRILATHTPSENRIPDSANKISSQITVDVADVYQSVTVDIDYDVITAAVPEAETDGSLCVIRDEVEHCVGGYHAFIEIPVHARFPYRSIQINWNPHGHYPAPFRVNHMDYHFHTQALAELRTIEVGTCGAEFVTCDEEKQKPLTQLLESRHIPTGYSNADLNTSVAVMGSHLIDFANAPRTPEAFTQVFIHGAYGGQLSFQEPMITKTYFEQLKEDTLAGRVDRDCNDIPQPQEYPDNNYHPQIWCNQYIPATDSKPARIRVSLENFTADLNQSDQSSSATQTYSPLFIPLLFVFFASIFF